MLDYSILLFSVAARELDSKEFLTTDFTDYTDFQKLRLAIFPEKIREIRGFIPPFAKPPLCSGVLISIAATEKSKMLLFSNHR
ncbi:MAG: hypothetical protein QM627_03230 [Luteolibacter sp.]